MKKRAKALVLKIIESLGYELTVDRVGVKNSHCKPTVFVHIPKCGGISVDRAIREKLARTGEKKLQRKPLIETSLFNFNRPINSLNDKCDFSEFHVKQIQDILVYHLNLNWRYVSGHVNVTSHILDHYAEQYQFVTLLRHPVERFISNYIFNRLTNHMTIMPPSLSNAPMTKEQLWQEADELINSRRGWHMANTMTMFLTGRYPKDATDAKAMQDEVLNNLAKFSVVGFLDDMPSFEQQLQKVTGKNIQVGQHNTTNNIETPDATHIRECLTQYFAQNKIKDLLGSLCTNELSIMQRLQQQRRF
ncbi:hypothetical protein AAD001_11570 [Colwelliaceae bacterium 6471]